jgi:hypothetical protein
VFFTLYAGFRRHNASFTQLRGNPVQLQGLEVAIFPECACEG